MVGVFDTTFGVDKGDVVRVFTGNLIQGLAYGFIYTLLTILGH
jgi:hypothetical protein